MLLHRGRLVETRAAAPDFFDAPRTDEARQVHGRANCSFDRKSERRSHDHPPLAHRRRARSPCCRAPASAQDKSIVVASTTSTQDSGLFGHILPLFKKKTGIDVKVVAQGTGQALDTGAARRCRRRVRARQIGGREIPRRRPRREALSR